MPDAFGSWLSTLAGGPDLRPTPYRPLVTQVPPEQMDAALNRAAQTAIPIGVQAALMALGGPAGMTLRNLAPGLLQTLAGAYTQPRPGYVEAGIPEDPERTAAGQILQRIEEPGVGRASFDKPHGIYTTPAGTPSPFEDLGGETFHWQRNPHANVLSFEETSDPEVIMRSGARGAGSGVWAARKLLGPEQFRELKNLSRVDLQQRAARLFPEVDWTRYYDKQEIMEGIGGMLARQHGYDAIELRDRTDPRWNEYVGLTPKSMTALPLETKR